MRHNSQVSKVLRIEGEYFRLSCYWGTEYSLVPCEASADAEVVTYLDNVELDGKFYILFRYRGGWAVRLVHSPQ